MARTAVVAGTATAVSNRVSRRQAERWAAQDAPPQQQYQEPPQQQYQEPPQQQAYYQAPPPPPAPAPAASGSGDGGSDLISQLQRLSQLHSDGALSDEEFAAAKAQLLG